MYTKQEASRTRSEFWTTFGQYMRPVPSATGSSVHWVNYKTGVKDIRYKMDADADKAIISIELSHIDESRRKLAFENFKLLKDQLKQIDNILWDWEDEVYKEGRMVSLISCKKTGINIFNRDTWPAIISFLKNGSISFDQFWAENKDIFEMTV